MKEHLPLILRGLGLAVAGAVVSYLSHQATSGDTFGTYGPLVAALCTILTDALHTLNKGAPDRPADQPEEKK